RHIAEALEVPFGFSAHAADLWLRGNRLEPEELGALGQHPLCKTVAVIGSRHRDYMVWCGVPEEKIIVTPNCVARSHLPPPVPRSGKSLRTVVTVGRPVAKKGYYTAVDAVRMLRLRGLAVELEVIGGADTSAPQGQAFAEYARQFDFVRAEGMLPNHEVLERIARADALVASCMVAENGDSDGIPTVLPEAMLLRVPVVATDVGSISDLVVDRETGFLCRAGDAAALAQKLNELNTVVQDRGPLENLLEAAARRAGRHDVAASINVLVAHLEKALGRI
ncbi:MAG: glycosyltransferase, partial [Bdellovibrionales bacterium]|nr:glycosyltransferase [Bdellovibrionales bacterium]